MTLCCECRISECLARPCKCNEVFLSVFPTVLATNPFEENFQHVTCISTSRHLSSASSPVLKEDEEQECIAQLKVAEEVKYFFYVIYFSYGGNSKMFKYYIFFPVVFG